MASAKARELKRKMRGIGATRRIVHAMEAVASAKLRKARAELAKSAPYTEAMRGAVNCAAACAGARHKFFDERTRGKALVIAVSSDMGLCGSFNAGVLNICADFSRNRPETLFIPIGSKLRAGLMRENAVILLEKSAREEHFGLAQEIGRRAVELFLSLEVSEVFAVYNAFTGAASYKPGITRLLPIADSAGETTDETTGETRAQMLFEPSADEVLDAVIPKYISAALYGAIIESAACAQAARMAAAREADENAAEMLETLTLRYNRARQEAITAEITEIAGAAQPARKGRYAY